MIEITLDRVLLEDGTSVFDLALTEPQCSGLGDLTIRARIDRKTIEELQYHIEGLLLDTEANDDYI